MTNCDCSLLVRGIESRVKVSYFDLDQLTLVTPSRSNYVDVISLPGVPLTVQTAPWSQGEFSIYRLTTFDPYFSNQYESKNDTRPHLGTVSQRFSRRR